MNREIGQLGGGELLDLDPHKVENVMTYTGLTQSSIYKLTMRRGIPFHRRGKKIYFLKSELMGWLLENRVQTRDELEGKAQARSL